MDVTFLGTGSAMPTGARVQTGLLIHSGDSTLVVDCGSGALHTLAATDGGYEQADTLLLTHHHLDHVSDVLPLLKARWLAGETNITIVGPPGTERLISDLLSVFEYMQSRIELTIREVESGDSFQLAGFDVMAKETVHSMYCLAYRIEDGETTFVFSGDSEASYDLVEFANGCDVLVHDCAFPDDVDVSNHPTPKSLGQVLSTAGGDIGTIYLTHLYPHTDGHHEEMLTSIEEQFDGDVRFAQDGMRVELQP